MDRKLIFFWGGVHRSLESSAAVRWLFFSFLYEAWPEAIMPSFHLEQHEISKTASDYARQSFLGI